MPPNIPALHGHCPVSQESLEVLRAMYPTTAADRKKHIQWTAFVKAVAELPVAFIPSHTDGSELAFEPSKDSPWYRKGKIVIHKPHLGK